MEKERSLSSSSSSESSDEGISTMNEELIDFCSNEEYIKR